jgi:glycerophosphoryl diester phosphodiesterase
VGGLTRRVGFDLQAHRGGAGLWPENTLEAFGHALTLGVSTLECDVHVTRDGVPVLSHERTYAGRLVPRSTYAELEGVATLGELFALVRERRADEVGLNVETKFDVLHPTEEAPREVFVEVLVDAVRAADLVDRTSVQSFDWAVLRLVRAAEPGLALNALTNTDYLEVDEPGASPWLAGLDIDDFQDSVPAAASSLGFDAISPSHTILTPAMVAEAHDAGLRVIPYTVDAPATMRRLLAMQVDGMITNRPDVLRDELAGMDLPLPPSYPPLA